MPEPRLVHRADPRTEIPDIGGVDPIGDDGKSFVGGDGGQNARQFRAAEITSVRRIGGVLGARELRHGHHPEGDADFRGLGLRVPEFASGEALRVRDHRQRVAAQRVVGEPRDETAVDPARIRDEGPPACREPAHDRVLRPREVHWRPENGP